jgi:hypothetical protein
MQNDLSPLSKRFDHILADIEIGRANGAVATLAGLLDAFVISAATTADECRNLLLGHPLGSALKAPMLANTIAELGFARAERARVQLARDITDCARAKGLHICLITPGRKGESYTLSQSLRKQESLFDGVIAPAIADDLTDAELLEFTRLAASRLKRGGQLCMSAFAPGHIGQGWQTIWLGRKLHCHDEAAFARFADAICATVNCFRDASGGLIWADFSLQTKTQMGEIDHGFSDPNSCDCRR